MSGPVQRIGQWLDERTGIKAVLHSALFEHIPGGARYRYVWGSTLVFAFTVQAITGIFLWMAYSPSGHTAWESVYYIQHQMQGGWLLRGLHHFMAQAMVVLLALHLLQVVIDGAYRAPREVNFWLGLILMQIVLGLSLTGYLLPWDQKGYWATRVATNLMGIVPGVGAALQKLVVGGSDYGHHTLTRFFALHAGLLPALLIGFLVLHVALFRRHGLHARQPLKKPDTTFWPDQVLKDAVACLAVLAVVLFFTIRPALYGDHQGQWSGAHLGAELGAPADPANEYSAARPEWYFLFLFQFLKLFEGHGETGEFLGAIVIPGVVMLLLFVMPLVGRWKLGHRFNVGLLASLLIGIGMLTGQAWWDDHRANYQELASANQNSSTAAAAAKGKSEEDEKNKAIEASAAYLKAVEQAEKEAHRVLELVQGPQGIPAAGALSILRKDPKTQGPRLFARYCASCHPHQDSPAQPDEVSAPDLTAFASRTWIEGLLDPKRVTTARFFGNTSHAEGEMANFVRDAMELDKTDLGKVIAALSAEAGLPAQRIQDRKDAILIAEGTELIKEGAGCTDCHQFHDVGDTGMAPLLTAWGSRNWLLGMIADPNQESYYGENNDRMPAFAAHPDRPEHNTLNPENLGLIVDWLRGDWYEPAGE